MKFSIIVGTYKQVDKLPKLIEALNNQTFKDFEVLFCNDGCKETAQFFKQGINVNFPYRYFEQKNKGMRLARNLNRGIKEANGEYCVFIMGDSFPEINYLEVLNDHAGEGKILCGIRIHVENDRGVDIDYRIKKDYIPKDNVLLVRSPWNLTTGNGLAIPTEALHTYGGWNEEIEGYGGDDNELVARLYYKGYTVWSIVDARLYHHYHRSTESKNRTKVTKLIYSYGH